MLDESFVMGREDVKHEDEPPPGSAGDGNDSRVLFVRKKRRCSERSGRRAGARVEKGKSCSATGSQVLLSSVRALPARCTCSGRCFRSFFDRISGFTGFYIKNQWSTSCKSCNPVKKIYVIVTPHNLPGKNKKTESTGCRACPIGKGPTCVCA